MFVYLEELLLAWADKLSVPVFAVVGAFVEEIIAPIPSPIVMMTAGVLLEKQVGTGGFLMVLLVAVLAAFSKTLASWILYFITDKLEDVIFGKWGKFFGIQHEFVESIGQKLNKGVKDYLTIFLLRAIPVIPSAPISILAGLVKIELKAYLVGTFAGTIIRNIIYLYIGFAGGEFMEKYNAGLMNVESWVEIGIAVLVAGAIVGGKLYFDKKNGVKE